MDLLAFAHSEADILHSDFCSNAYCSRCALCPLCPLSAHSSALLWRSAHSRTRTRTRRRRRPHIRTHVRVRVESRLRAQPHDSLVTSCSVPFRSDPIREPSPREPHLLVRRAAALHIHSDMDIHIHIHTNALLCTRGHTPTVLYLLAYSSLSHTVFLFPFNANLRLLRISTVQYSLRVLRRCVSISIESRTRDVPPDSYRRDATQRNVTRLAVSPPRE